MIISVLMLISLSGARLIVPDAMESSSILDRDLLDELNGKDPSWTEDEMKLYIRVFHKNMFFKKKISATHHASAWGLV